MTYVKFFFRSILWKSDSGFPDLCIEMVPIISDNAGSEFFQTPYSYHALHKIARMCFSRMYIFLRRERKSRFLKLEIDLIAIACVCESSETKVETNLSEITHKCNQVP